MLAGLRACPGMKQVHPCRNACSRPKARLMPPNVCPGLRRLCCYFCAGAHACNYIANPSFEEAADDFGLALAEADTKRGGLQAVGWKPLEAIAPGPHYVRAVDVVHRGAASMRLQCLDACAVDGKGWRGVYQHVVMGEAGAEEELLLSLWVAAEGLTEGAGVYVEASYSAAAGTDADTFGSDDVEYARASEDKKFAGGGSGVHRYQSRPKVDARQAWGSGYWGARPAVFVKDLTAHIAAGTYGWWPLSVVVPRWDKVAGGELGRGKRRRVLSATVYVLMRAASGTLWVDSVSLSPLSPPPGRRLSVALGGLRGVGEGEARLAGAGKGGAAGKSWGEGGRGRRVDDEHLWRGLDDAGKAAGMRDLRVFHRRAGAAVRQDDADSDVTLVTQLSVDRLGSLDRQIEHWPSFLSAAVLVTDVGQELAVLEEWWLRSPGAAERVDVHVVVWDAKSLQGQGQMGGLAQYPVNLLRNVAMLAARTEVVLLLHVNFDVCYRHAAHVSCSM